MLNIYRYNQQYSAMQLNDRDKRRPNYRIDLITIDREKESTNFQRTYLRRGPARAWQKMEEDVWGERMNALYWPEVITGNSAAFWISLSDALAFSRALFYTRPEHSRASKTLNTVGPIFFYKDLHSVLFAIYWRIARIN